MESILVTGGAGFIGSHVCDRLLVMGKEVICLDNFNDYYDPEIKHQNIKHNLKNPNYHLERVDILEIDKLADIFQKYNISKVIHLAARAGVRPSLKEPILYFDVNVKGTLNLLELSVKHKIKNFVFGSSSSVYGTNKKVPFSEEDSTDVQVSPYASSKKCGEMICRTYSEIYGLNITCLRFFTVYGPRGRPDMAPFKFVEAISKGKKIDVYGDGTSQRDYTYVEDILSGIISVLEKNFRFEIINLGDSNPIELKKFIRIIEMILGKKASVEHKSMPLGDVPITYADISKAKRLLNYEPQIKIEKGMQLFIQSYLKTSDSK